MKKEKKIQIIEELKEKLGKAKSWVLTDYQGLTNKQMEDLRRDLKTVKADFIVTKNTLLALALQNTKCKIQNTSLSGPTATIFSYEDEIAPLQKLVKFRRLTGLLTLKIGILGNKVLKTEELLMLATLPPREVLLATLVARLKSPMYGLHYSLNWNLQKLVLVLNAKVRKES